MSSGSLRPLELLGKHIYGGLADTKGSALTWDVGLDLELVRLLHASDIYSASE